MNGFIPNRVFYEPEALEYPLGFDLVNKFRQMGITVQATSSHNRITGIPGKTATEAYREAKRTLVIGIRRGKDFQTCKPSAHYQLPLVTSCPGMCEYCYLQTTLGRKPYIRVYVNIDEILAITKDLIQKRLPEVTLFEGAATSDPLPVEDYTGALKKTIEFFGKEKNGRFRFVTKFTNVETLLNINHNGNTRFRFSVNAEEIVKKYEHGTPSANDRIKAASKVLKAGYPLGFIIAPIFIFEGWEDQYRDLFISLGHQLKGLEASDLTFEFISHRYTSKAKSNILQVFPKSVLPMNEEERKFKYGQFGYGKYIYREDEMTNLKELFKQLVNEKFPEAKIEYLI